MIPSFRQHPDICLPSVKTGCLETISTPTPFLYNIIIIPASSYPSYLFFAHKNLAPVSIGRDYALLLEHQIIPDTAVNSHINNPCTMMDD